MGAVHGVYLKYVALSGLSYLGYNVVMDGVGLLALAKVLGHEFVAHALMVETRARTIVDVS